MKREYEPPKIEIEYFTISSPVCKVSNNRFDSNELGWEEEDW